MKMLKEGMAGDMLGKTGQNKVRLGICFIKNSEISYGWGFILLKMLK